MLQLKLTVLLILIFTFLSKFLGRADKILQQMFAALVHF